MINLKKPQLDTRVRFSSRGVEVWGSCQSPKVAEFEEIFREMRSRVWCFCKLRHGRFSHSLSSDIGPGDEVVCTSFSFIATASPILMCGATPVFVDINEANYNIDVSQIADAVTPRTKAVIGVNLYGG